MLFDPARHEALRGGPWSVDAARDGILAIVADSCRSFDPRTLWPVHPRDLGEGYPALPVSSLYDGAAGVVWALWHLRSNADVRCDIDLKGCAAGLIAHQRRYNAAMGMEAHSYLLSDPGILLLDWKLNRNVVAAHALFASAEANLYNPTCESLWGSPGTLIAVIHMLESTGEARWRELLQRGADLLWTQMQPLAGHPGAWVWTQDMYGKKRRWTGAGHGFVGNVFPILRGAAWLPPEQVQQFVERTEATLATCMTVEDGGANWDCLFDPVSVGLPSKMMLQDCHGAPGFICRLASSGSPTLNDWLLSAGELVWRAGPLNKGQGLCHGTAGNGYALLKLYQSTGDDEWLDRARSFAMHALAQTAQQAAQYGHGRYSLWTGDLAVALLAAACISGDAAYPTLDVF